ncbi:hypothetical protein E2C01_016285 [Portunus trituberculatus]|uniref:Uncharacterized protein n=1 Tax=Portunus trituberculatus TaxID=210409 RepID=A0A5B7DPV5_PORTR|nr:hypothetical protein [Portunus trituberculatus]
MKTQAMKYSAGSSREGLRCSLSYLLSSVKVPEADGGVQGGGGCNGARRVHVHRDDTQRVSLQGVQQCQLIVTLAAPPPDPHQMGGWVAWGVPMLTFGQDAKHATCAISIANGLGHLKSRPILKLDRYMSTYQTTEQQTQQYMFPAAEVDRLKMTRSTAAKKEQSKIETTSGKRRYKGT